MTVPFEIQLNIPSASDFVAGYPQYKAALSTEAWLFELLTQPEVIVAMFVLTDRTSLPAVSAAARAINSAAAQNGGLTRFKKQFSGAVTCCIMERNGYTKTGKKRSVGVKEWSVGEVYLKL